LASSVYGKAQQLPYGRHPSMLTRRFWSPELCRRLSPDCSSPSTAEVPNIKDNDRTVPDGALGHLPLGSSSKHVGHVGESSRMTRIFPKSRLNPACKVKCRRSLNSQLGLPSRSGPGLVKELRRDRRVAKAARRRLVCVSSCPPEIKGSQRKPPVSGREGFDEQSPRRQTTTQC